MNTVYNNSKKKKRFSSTISGSKECFNEPKDLTQKVREALSKTSDSENTSETKTTTTDTDTPNAPNKNDKEDDSESVKQRDKV